MSLYFTGEHEWIRVEGDTATIEAPGGTREYEIVEVGYGS